MGRENSTTDKRRGKHLIKTDRIAMEVMLNKRHGIKEIAEFLGRHRRTIEREIRRVQVERLNSDLTRRMAYSSDRGQDAHDLNATAKGPELKLGTNYTMASYVSKQIREDNQSPGVVADRMKTMDMAGRVCAKTLYAYIDQGLIKGVTNENLWEKRKRKKYKRRSLRRLKKRHPCRTSIEKRPEKVEKREEFGHWEIDLVVGGKDASKPVLMTLVERKTRQTIIRKLPNKTQQAVLKALRSMEGSMGAPQFRAQFKSITADNGNEFLDVESMERSAFSKKKRVKLYYAHPYSSWERGSNENANRFIRRFIAKGRDIGAFSSACVQTVQDWINNYPRKCLSYQSAQHCYTREIAA